jgi:DNA polymerase III alpha subunit
MHNPDLAIKECLCETVINFDDILELENQPKIKLYKELGIEIEEFDNNNQNNWYMPIEYKTLDIAKYILDLCKTDYELQRVGEELIKYQERDMFTLLRYCKYLVDTMRKNNIIWGVGRGSSVSSYVLYLLGIHRINSIHYDLSIDEFLK